MHRAQYIFFPPTGVTGTGPELPERTLNIIHMSLKFLRTFAWNPTITAIYHDHSVVEGQTVVS